MSKVKIETMGGYQQVVDVIGVEKAKVELFKMLNFYPKITPVLVELDQELQLSFDWEESIQGFQFWADIDEGENPYGE